jgi:hypothetical protein
VHFIRRKSHGSRGKDESSRNATFAPSTFWRKLSQQVQNGEE